MARVVFPDGRVLFANWHSNSCAVGDQLYAGFLPADGERERIDPETELPARPDLPTGGQTVDAQARSAIAAIVDCLTGAGLLAAG